MLALGRSEGFGGWMVGSLWGMGVFVQGML